ncbi:hypoxanthine phosphoribosyltransferase [bacterium endosymbiont of Pedicinus badii]|uniref:hypoxanthine phosphoribosyltransferase n=1 Tax=bacterium endosymbiont of Pedicinus badii TaxID=1719126 RepID=UPI0009BB9F4F|nr:hypoxanthine phosphoribosyltransferase [bacterium endosymbiont of Pedicinus badii]OQM34234.1 hypoxanthine phosphoribosyltransferase [bacterium endosymbiont of Pedicinus badii]
MKYNIEVLIPQKEIYRRVLEMGKTISDCYKSKKKILLVGILKGSFIFIADLCRSITIKHEIDFITISSYRNSTFSNKKNIRIVQDLEQNIFGKDIIIIEDIIDSGNTIKKLKHLLFKRKPNSISICCLLNKKETKDISIEANWIGFNIPNTFVVGYGMDYGQKYRNLPFIGKISHF